MLRGRDLFCPVAEGVTHDIEGIVIVAADLIRADAPDRLREPRGRPLEGPFRLLVRKRVDRDDQNVAHVGVAEIAKCLTRVSLEAQLVVIWPQAEVVGNAAVDQMKPGPFFTIHIVFQRARLGFAAGAPFILCGFSQPRRRRVPAGPGIALDGDGSKENRHGRGGRDRPSQRVLVEIGANYILSLIHISEPTRPAPSSRMPSSA